MHIRMTKEHSKRLAQFLREKRDQKAQELERDYDWKEMAEAIGLTPETLRKLKSGRGGMNLVTAQQLRRAFGDEVLVVLGLDPGTEPSFKVNPKD